MNFKRLLHPNLKKGYVEDFNNSSANYAFFSAIEDILSSTEKDTIDSKVESYLNSADGEFLDEWGSWFGVARKDNQSDDDYRKWIITYATLKRGTKKAIIDAIKMYLDMSDATISVYEPYKNVFQLDKSKLDGLDHLSGDYYRWGIINIFVDRPVPESIYQIIRDFKPAGVNFFITVDTSTNKNNQPLSMDTGIKEFNSVEEAYIGFSKSQSYYLDLGGRNNKQELKNPFILDKSKLDSTDVLAGGYNDDINYDDIPSNYNKAFIYGVSYIGSDDVFSGNDWNYQTNSYGYNDDLWNSATVFDKSYFTSDKYADLDGYTRANYSSQIIKLDYSGMLSQNINGNNRVYGSVLYGDNNISTISYDPNNLVSPDKAVPVITKTDKYYTYSLEYNSIDSSYNSIPDKLNILISASSLNSNASYQVDLLDKYGVPLKTQIINISGNSSINKIVFDNEVKTEPSNPFTISKSKVSEGVIGVTPNLMKAVKLVRIYCGIRGDSLNNNISFGVPSATIFDTDTWLPFSGDQNQFPVILDENLQNLSKKDDNQLTINPVANYNVSTNSYTNVSPASLKITFNLINDLYSKYLNFWDSQGVIDKKDIISKLLPAIKGISLTFDGDLTNANVSYSKEGNLTPISDNSISNDIITIDPNYIDNDGNIVILISGKTNSDKINIDFIRFYYSLNDKAIPTFSPNKEMGKPYLKFFGKGIDYSFYDALTMGSNNIYVNSDIKDNSIIIAINARKQLEYRYGIDENDITSFLNNSNSNVLLEILAENAGNANLSIANLNTGNPDSIGNVSFSNDFNYVNISNNLNDFENYVSNSGFIFLSINPDTDLGEIRIKNLYIFGKYPTAHLSTRIKTGISMDITVFDSYSSAVDKAVVDKSKVK